MIHTVQWDHDQRKQLCCIWQLILKSMHKSAFKSQILPQIIGHTGIGDIRSEKLSILHEMKNKKITFLSKQTLGKWEDDLLIWDVTTYAQQEIHYQQCMCVLDVWYNVKLKLESNGVFVMHFFPLLFWFIHNETSQQTANVKPYAYIWIVLQLVIN